MFQSLVPEAKVLKAAEIEVVSNNPIIEACAYVTNCKFAAICPCLNLMFIECYLYAQYILHMAVITHDVQCIALKQLETSLSLYFKGEDYYSVITLAGAAEEIFGKLVLVAEGQNALSSDISTANEISKILFGQELSKKEVIAIANMHRNSLKHWNPGSSKIIEFDVKEEAEAMLHRAIENYYTLTQDITPAMKRFYDMHVRDEPQIRKESCKMKQ